MTILTLVVNIMQVRPPAFPHTRGQHSTHPCTSRASCLFLLILPRRPYSEHAPSSDQTIPRPYLRLSAGHSYSTGLLIAKMSPPSLSIEELSEALARLSTIEEKAVKVASYIDHLGSYRLSLAGVALTRLHLI